MSGATWPSVPADWRNQAESSPGASLRRRVALTLCAVAILVGGLATFLPYLRPPARCHFVPLLVSSYRDPGMPDLPWRGQDHSALNEGEFFGGVAAQDSARLDQAALVRQLGALARRPTDESIVVYLSAYARTDAAGGVQILPADADLSDPATWLPLQRVLELLTKSAARHRLLVLDLEPLALARREVIFDDIAACVPHDLDAVPDSRRLVLCSCAPGQRALSSEILERSVFGHYVEEGLRGAADADGDGRVSVHELAAYTKARADRWARRTREARQTPTLYGTASDFALVDLPNGLPREPRELPPDRTYPDGLAKAWAKSNNLLSAENAWRAGEGAERVQQRIAAAPTEPVAPPRPPPRSLGAALGDRVPPATLLESLRTLILQVEPRVRGLAEDKAIAVRSQVVEKYLEGIKEVSTPILALAALEVAISESRPEALHTCAAVLAAREPEPSHVESLALRRVAALGLPVGDAQRLLEAVRAGEQAGRDPRLYAWLGPDLEEAARRRHEALVLFASAGYADREDARGALDRTVTATAALSGRLDLVREAVGTSEEEAAFLPQALMYMEVAGRPIEPWFAAVLAARSLTDELGTARRSPLAGRVEALRRATAQSRAAMAELREPFTEIGIERRRESARRPGAGGSAVRDLDGLLHTTLVPSTRRAELWTTLSQLMRRLEEEVVRLDRADGTTLGTTPAVGTSDPLPALRLQARTAAGLLELARLASRLPVEAKATRVALADGERSIRAAWKAPAPDADAGLFAWLADWFRYERREWVGLLPDSAEAGFYARAEADYRPWLRQARERYADIVESGNPPRLLPGTPITQRLEVRASGREPGTPLVLETLLADREWLTISPRRAVVPVGESPDAGGFVPVTVALSPRAGEGRAAIPQGFLARARFGEGRAFHRRVALPLSPRAPEILLGRAEIFAEPALARIRLRAIERRQVVYAFVRNPLDRPWGKLSVRLVAGGETRETAVFALAPREVKRLAFPPAPAPAIAPGAAPTIVTNDLPELAGPLLFEVVDRESKDEVITRRSVTVELATPGEYVAVTGGRFDPTGGRNRLAIQVRLRQALPGMDVAAEMGFLPPADGGATYTTGTLRGKLPATGESITLFADGVRGNGGKAIFFLSVDGWARAMLFEVTLSAAGAVTPTPLLTPVVRPRIGGYATAGPKFSVPIEADNPPDGATLEVSLGRLIDGEYRVEAVARRASARESRVGWMASGPGGAMVFQTGHADWVVPLDTSRIRGVRELRVRLLDRGGNEKAIATRTLILGDEAPDSVEFVDPPAKAWRLAPLALKVRGRDAVGIKQALFFVGRPVEGKPPAGVVPMPGMAANDVRTLWAVKLPLPQAQNGPTDITVQLVNQIGLSTFATTSVELTEEDPAKTAAGKITGTVVQGGQPQADLDVVLTDEKGAEKGKAKTKADGTYEFADVAPGKYRLNVKKANNGRVAAHPSAKVDDFFTMAPGGSVSAQLALLLP